MDPQVALEKRVPKEIEDVLDLKVALDLGESLVVKVRLEETASVAKASVVPPDALDHEVVLGAKDL